MATTENGIEHSQPRTPESVATIARCWRYPDEQLAAALENGLFDDALPSTPSLDTLKTAYTRLFIGPGDVRCPPYENVYRDPESNGGHGHVLGDATKSVVEWYRRYDLAPDSTWTDLPDHIAVELEFIASLESTDPDAVSAFVHEHPQQWMPPFLKAVRQHADRPFYSHLAEVTEEYVAVQE